MIAFRGALSNMAVLCSVISNKNVVAAALFSCNVDGGGLHWKKHTVPDLPYDYDSLEPVISGEIMRLHHHKHHTAYVNNLNVAEEKTREALEKEDISTVLSLQPALKFNGGGHLNHSIFWTNLAPPKHGGGGEPTGALLEQIQKDFGSVNALQERLSALAVGVQGSGWAWLGYCRKDKRLRLAACANQDPLEATTGWIPLFGIDVWEHAYYLQYKNVRPDYVKAIWRVANWANVAERLESAKA